jgi:cytochrome c oxidase cbb3-type subunit IV
MDVNTLRTILTLICFILFLGIVAWAWSSGTRTRFEDAARVPLNDDNDGGRDSPLRHQ